MAQLTNDELRQAVADGQGATGTSALPVYWPSTIPRANREAYNALRSKLLGRGFTVAQAAAWLSSDEGRDWNTTLGVCKACWNVSKGSEDRGESFRREWEELLKEFDEYAIVIDGELVNPTDGDTTVGFGSYDTTDDLHTMDDTL